MMTKCALISISSIIIDPEINLNIRFRNKDNNKVPIKKFYCFIFFMIGR